MEMPKGYDSHVEARGANFSGGQKQRIAIARALLLDPSILILDDSTSSVDVETETRIQEALDKQMHQHTSFVVAQRISTVLNADKIIVIDHGRIVAQGTHRELIQTSPIYQEIYESQLGNGFHKEKELLASRKGAWSNDCPSFFQWTFHSPKHQLPDHDAAPAGRPRQDRKSQGSQTGFDRPAAIPRPF